MKEKIGIVILGLGLLFFVGILFASDTVKSVTVTNTTTEILPRDTNRRKCVLYNNGTTTAYLGFSPTVNTTVGLPFPPAMYGKFEDKSDPIYGIVATGTTEIRVWEVTR